MSPRPALYRHDHTFYALDAGTGDSRWRFAANGPISGSAAVIDGLVYFSTFNERTYALNANSGRLITSWPDGSYSPAVADPNHLYLVGLAAYICTWSTLIQLGWSCCLTHDSRSQAIDV